MYMTILIGTCIISLALLIWFRTDAWLEYTKLLHLNFLSFYKDFDEKREKDATLTYSHYLRMYHDCFLVRLITCPICLAIWLGLAICLVGVAMVFSPLPLLLMPVMVTGGLLLFSAIDRLLG